MSEAEVAAWVQRQLGYSRPFTDYAALGFGEPLVAGVVFHDWQPENGTIELTVASTAPWATRARLWAIGEYVGRHARLAVFKTSERNQRALRLMKRLGAQMTIVPELRGPGEAEVVCTISHEGWYGLIAAKRA